MHVYSDPDLASFIKKRDLSYNSKPRVLTYSNKGIPEDSMEKIQIKNNFIKKKIKIHSINIWNIGCEYFNCKQQIRKGYKNLGLLSCNLEK
mgnify:CR=1 FL=1